mmetsp:Transcript_29328/g.86756  ORF Transcript_29328/g.86756 Transcript_29328/m.86756 type:complete len:292 (-) Transcript_29328:995-1870(-)
MSADTESCQTASSRSGPLSACKDDRDRRKDQARPVGHSLAHPGMGTSKPEQPQSPQTLLRHKERRLADVTAALSSLHAERVVLAEEVDALRQEAEAFPTPARRVLDVFALRESVKQLLGSQQQQQQKQAHGSAEQLCCEDEARGRSALTTSASTDGAQGQQQQQRLASNRGTERQHSLPELLSPHQEYLEHGQRTLPRYHRLSEAQLEQRAREERRARHEHLEKAHANALLLSQSRKQGGNGHQTSSARLTSGNRLTSEQAQAAHRAQYIAKQVSLQREARQAACMLRDWD